MAKTIDKSGSKEGRPKRAKQPSARGKAASTNSSFLVADRTKFKVRSIAPESGVAPELLNRAIQVFGTRRKAVDWLTSPIAALGGKVPAGMSATKSDQQKVYDELGRIEHGVF